ncbi:MAG: bifunctional chorismate mutase/prephenate dehydratase [Blautia sp.]|nr:bifunctional chorismate mutase/prephenate dehydratase [Blautia sp.]
MGSMEEYRSEIDAIDGELIRLFEKRMQVAEEIAAYKMSVGKAVYDAQREAKKLSAVKEMANGAFNQAGATELFKLIMSISRKRQYQLLTERGVTWDSGFEQREGPSFSQGKIVYQGVPGSYSQAATRAFFGEDVKAVSVPLWRDAMEEVTRGKAAYCVLPIENSTAGFVEDIYDLLTQYDLTIVGEKIIHVDHVLLGLSGAALSGVNKVYSHPQALMQCRPFFEAHPSMEKEETVNTAGAAKMVAEGGDPTKAAIASREAGRLYGLEVLAEGLCKDTGNATRFVILGREKMYAKEAKKVSIVFELAHTSGSLYQLLSHIIYNGLNMTKIESRPIREKAWEYRFFVDFEGNLSDGAVMDALRGIQEEADFFRVLGNY